MLGERVSVAKTLLEDVDALLRQASARPTELDALVVGTGPGSFTSTRIGLAVARGLALALGIEGAGVSTLDALAAGAGRRAAGDRRPPRRGLRARCAARVAPGGRVAVEGALCVGDGAVRYRDVLEANGASVPPDDDPRHVPRARAPCASRDVVRRRSTTIEPIYVRAPDAERWAT